MSNITLWGAQLSPFVRKVRYVLGYKNIDYKLVQVVPFIKDQLPEAFATNSPLGKIPLMQVDDQWLPDSSVICAYLERAYPETSILPSDPIKAARALWYEEYADSQMITAFGAHLFAEIVLAPFVFQRDPIQSDIDMALNTEIPAIFDYLEKELTESTFAGHYLLGDEPCLADYASGSFFVTYTLCDQRCDAGRWPKTAAYIDRLLEGEFAALLAEDKAVLSQMTGGRL